MQMWLSITARGKERVLRGFPGAMWVTRRDKVEEIAVAAAGAAGMSFSRLLVFLCPQLLARPNSTLK